MIQNMTYFMKKIGFYLMVKDTPISLPEHPRFGQLLRTLMVGLLLLSGSVAWGQTNYVFYNGTNGYIYNNGSNGGVTTTFTKSCIWVASADLGTTSRTIYSYTDNSKYMRGGNGSFSLGNSQNYWQTRNSVLAYRYTYSYHVYWTGSALSCARNQSDRGFTPSSITIRNSTPSNPTISISAAAELSSGGIQLTGNVTGTYTPSYSYASVHNYNNNNSTTYYWTSTTEATTTQPSSVSSWGDATKSWEVTAGSNASVDGNGLLTFTGDPGSNVTVRLTVSMGGYTGTQTITLTRAAVAQNVTSTTTLTTPTITPATQTLEFGESQTFTAAATATTTTSTVPAHTTLTGGGNTYYYYNGALHNAAPAASEPVVTHPEPTYTWALTGAAATGGYLTPTSGSGSTINITYGTASNNNANATLTVTASATGATNKTATATITANRTMPTSITATPTSLTIPVGGSGQSTYTLTPAGAYDEVTATSSNTGVATVGRTGNTINITGVSAGSAVITVSAARPGSTPVTTTITVTVKEVCVTPTITITPAAGGNTASVTLSTTTAGATIYYTTNGSDPSSSSTAYSGSAFEIGNGETVKAIAVKDGCIDSEIASQTYTADKIATPTISITSSGVTFDCETSGVTFYYTTDGSTPTTSSTAWNGSPVTGISEGATIKVIAAKTGMVTSDPATTTYYPATAVSDGTVTINDYEDHSWSYYSDPKCPIHSLNPADVKITYNGNGTGTVQTNNNDTPTTWGANATTVKVGIDADASTFVYYETLERSNGRTATSITEANGRCAYTTIANPFSVRPTYNSDNTSKYRGFYAWRVKTLKGGTIHSAATGGTSYTEGSTINAETEIYFAPSSEYGMEVEFEALWARAYVSTSAAGNHNLGVERNFYVITASANSNITAGSYPCTYTSIYPNGTTDGETAATSVTVYKYGGFTASADSKIEYIILRNNNSTVNANGKNFTIGRGVSGYNGGLCATNLYGLNASQTTSFHFNFASGRFTNLYFCGDGRSMTSGVLTSVIGCDYDRAMGDNDNLEITTDIIAGHNGTGGSNNNEGADFLLCTVKSGDFDLGDYGGGAQFYLSLWGNTGSGTYGKKTMVVEGGIFSDISGGIDVEDNQVAAADMVEIRVKGGTINGALYGAAQYAAAYGNRYIIVTGGEMKGWVAGGANGTQTTGGKLTGDTYVYFGGRARCDSNGSNTTMGSGNATGGNIFGAGSGNSGAASTATVGEVNNSTVVIADKCYVERNVYGGGNYGSVAAGTGHKSDIYIKGGTVNGSVFGGSNNQKGQIVNINMTDGQVNTGIYGGSNATGTVTGPVNIQIDGGQVGTSSKAANVHGGGYGNSTTVSGNVTMTIGTSTSATDWVEVYGNVYGGSALGTVSGNATITMNKGEINGNLFGGALGNNTYDAQVNGDVAVTVHGGKVTGAVFGCNDANGTPKGTVTVTVDGTDPTVVNSGTKTYALQGVYGGGNLAHYNPTTATNGYPKVIISNCNTSIKDVYGGGNAAAVPQTDVTINGGDIGRVFAGGNGESSVPANVGYQNKNEPTTANTYGNGTATAKIYGGTIGQVFGGSNAHGVIRGNVSVTIDKSQSTANPKCDMIVGEVYGGGNMAESKAASVSIGCTGTLTPAHSTNPDNIGKTLEGIGAVFGGANQAAVTSGNITVNIKSGIVANVFGGNNKTGNISGTIEVNIEKTGESADCGWYVGNVFGGGNLAQYFSPNDGNGNPTYPHVNILNGTVSGNVYGGGKGDPNDHSKGQVTGNPIVTIGDASRLNDNTVTAVVGGDVYGGGDAGNVVGTPQVNVINKCNTSIANVYGGGNAADVNGTDVNIDGGNITGMVFGGGHGDKDANPQKQADVKGNVAVDITGGTIAKVFGGSNSKGNITGTVAVNIAKGDNSCDMHITEVYGGGNEAAGNAGTLTIGCTGDFTNNNEGIGDVYGGANAADINNNISLSIRGGHINRVFGGNNSSGRISGTIAVEVNWDDNLTCDKYLGNVFGGGNVAAYTGSPTVTLTNGTVSHSVYGGGNEAGVGGSTVNINGGSVIDGVYGGCNTSGDVSGNIVVNINGGTLGTPSARLTSGIFGGGFGSATTTGGNVTVNVGNVSAASAAATSTIYGDIYGGSALGTVNDAVADLTTVNINNGTIHGNIYGGGLGAATLNDKGYIASVTTEAIVNGTVHVNIGTETQTSNFVTIDGQVFGCNNLAGTPKGNVFVDVYKMAHTAANAYPTTVPASATDVTEQASTAFAIAAVYGGGNLAHYTTTTENAATHVHIHGCDNTIMYVYGGGNAASSPATDVIIDGGSFNYIFGGGNGAGDGNPGANIVGNAVATINGGLVYRAFGGSNTRGTIGGTSSVDLPTTTTCTRMVREIFGGGNEAPGGNVDMVIPCGTTGTGILYAGANNADMGTQAAFEAGNPVLIKLTVEGGDFTQVFGGNNQGGTIWGNVELYLKGGTIANAFGGNNLGGNIKGTIKVFVVDDENTTCPLVLTNVYGGGYNAAYTPADPTIESPLVYVNHLKSGNKILGNVFGGGYGTPATVTANPVVTIGDMESGHESKIATIAGNVYGGGEQASVVGSTKVIMQKSNSVVEGTIYGAGKGVDNNPEAALVTKNTLVQMTDGQVQRSIYGGGELSSVGTFTETYDATSGVHTDANYHVKGEPKTCAANTGLTEVLISGGRVGLVNQLMPDPANPTSDDDYGYVFCAGKGMADPTQTNGDGVPFANLLAVCGSSHLEISGTALIAASVYGGSENGQVLGDTYVEIKGGQIGSGHYKEGDTHHWDAPYTDAQWTAAINAIKSGDTGTINTAVAPFHECDAWPFGAEGNRHVYDYFHGTTGYDSKGGGKPGSDGHSYYGHVFGGGSGYYPYAAGLWRRTAGRVNGNTLVEISGGHVLTNVYGGNEITDVLGSSTVHMTGGTVGVPRTIAGIQARPVNSYIFGAGMGDPRVMFNGWSNVASANVIVEGNAVVFGSVFGGGEDGHVLGDVSTTIKGDALIGTFGSSSVDGNIFGSGRGFSALALTAGTVCGNVTVNIAERAKILGSIFGGGRMAAVGTYLALETDPNYGKLQPGNTHGNVTVNITGGTIGNQSQMSTSAYSIGDVFGGSKGTLMSDWAKTQKLGLVKNTTVNISQAEGSTTTILGNVYGGGELASVGSYTYATAAQATDYNGTTPPPSEPLTEGDVNGMLEDGTGLATITITGGTIGQNSLADKKGSVFGGCLGKAGPTFSGYSFVNNSDVTLNGGTVYGSIFGGGENGHVFHDTDVKIKKGTVGISLHDKVIANLSDAEKDNMIYRGNVYGGGRGIDKTSGNDYSITAGKVNGNTNVTVEGDPETTIIYRNVYGGGSLASVGNRDEAENTSLVTDTHPFPYNTGLATVTILGGKIGTDGGAAANDYTTNIPKRENRKENGFVFGSGRGMAAGSNTTSTLVQLAYTKNTIVNIEDTGDPTKSLVTGSVFGGGENGHVRNNTKVFVKGGSVGTELTNDEHAEDENGRGRLLYRGNVYGGGRGIDTAGDGEYYSLTAGRVYGDTYVEVSGGRIYHDVFGGGSLASVGNETVDPVTGDVSYGDESGETEVHIKGGIIGYSSTASKQGFNCGFVYGGCRGLSAASNSDIVKMAYVHDTKVYIEPGADVKGSVFGGGANGHVKNDTYVEISGGSIGTPLISSNDASNEVGFDDHGVAVKPVFRGNVYAGGRGVDQYYTSGSSSTEAKYSLSAGAVYGNAELLMTGGHVWHNIYGSGAMASVGTVKAKAAGQHVHDEVVDGSGNLVNNVIYNPDESDINYLTGVFKSGTGKVTVTITGGTVGDTTAGHEGINNGNVYGAGRGVSADRSDYVASMEYVNETDVTIGTSGQQPSSYSGSTPDALNYPYIYGSVFGGGENGHVKQDTDVKIYSGIIGFPLVEGTSQEYKTAADGSSKNPYRGNVFGGGRGVDPVHHSTSEQRSSSAGRVYGHTNVTMTGGVVRRAIYGGGLLASVGVYRLNKDDDMHITDMIEDEEDGGDATVTISGGYIGNVNPDGTALSGTNASGIAYLVPGDNNGHVFGSSCGMVADNYEDPTTHQQVDVQYRQMGYSHSTHVSISGNDTRVFGSVFGSGENGHVWEDTRIDISGGEIGYQTNSSTFIYAGNVYGSGRGVDHPHSPTGISETAGKVRGNTTVNLTGGIVWRDVYGGGSLASVGEADEAANDSKKNITTNPTTNNPFPYSTGLTRVVIDGTSAVHGSVYGSGRGVASTNAAYKQAAYVKNTLVTVKGSAHVFQNVFGGGNAGHVRKNTDVTIDGSSKVDGNVYGGGAGDISSPTAGLVNHDVAVNIKGGLIAHDVYGGGAIANSNVHDVRNTAVTECTDTNRGNAKTLVNLTGGIILGDAYGGGQGVIPASTATAAEIANAAALVQGDVTVTLNGTAFYPTTINDNSTPAKAVPASGRVFGCNNLNGTPQGTVLVKVLKTVGVTESGGTYSVKDTHTKSVYDASGTLTTNNYEVGAVYGGGNLAAYEPWDPAATGQYSTDVVAASNPLQVVIDGCNETSIDYVYGGGNAASVPSAQVTVLGTYEIGTVFGGGNGKDKYTLDGGTTWNNNLGAHVGYKADGTTPYTSGTGDANVYLYGGTIHNAFGASNTLGNIRGKAEVHVDEKKNGTTPICPLILDELYGGGNEAYMAGGTNIDLGCITSLKTIYGGAKNANVGGDINLTITSGHFDRVFGGNNVGGVINGAITVNIEETGCNPITIGELYGCGNQARYTTPGSKHPTINVRSFTSIGRIFGGGLGESAIVTGNPTVNINVVEGDFASTAYAGSSVTLDGVTINLPAHDANAIGAIGTVFGGGNAAEVIGNTNVNIGTEATIKYTSDAVDATGRTVKGADIRGNVFGGGNQAKVTGNTNVVVGKDSTTNP